MLRLLFLAALALSISACDSSEVMMEDPGVPDPSFQVPTIPQAFADGTPGLQFAAVPNADIELSSVVIRNPLGDQVTFNAGNQLVLAGTRIALQEPDFVFFRVSGEWTFSFTGIKESGAGERFSVATTVPVSARTRN